MKPIEALIVDGDAELFSYEKLKEMLMDALKGKNYDELKWDHKVYNHHNYLNPIRMVRVTTFQIIRDVKELEGGSFVF